VSGTTMGRISPALAIQSCPHAAAMAGRRWEKSPLTPKGGTRE